MASNRLRTVTWKEVSTLAVLILAALLLSWLRTGDPALGQRSGSGESCPEATPAFVDVPPGHYAADAIGCLFGLGIVHGVTGDTFVPYGKATRSQAAASLARFLRAAGVACEPTEAAFSDVGDDHFASGDIGCLARLGVVQAVTDDVFQPGSDVTRAEFAMFLARGWRAAGHDCPSASAPFTDVDDEHPASTHIDCLYGLGITVGTTSDTFAPDLPITRAQVAVMLAKAWKALPATGPAVPDTASGSGAGSGDPSSPTPQASTTTAAPTDCPGVLGADEFCVTVGPEIVDCTAVGVTRCMVVDGEFFYTRIIGFTHTEGCTYVLKIRRSDRFPGVEEPPQDVIIYRYDLISVISSTCSS